MKQNTTAHEIMRSTNDWNEIIKFCESSVNLIETNQNWEKENTTYIFKDGSSIVIGNYDWHSEQKGE